MTISMLKYIPWVRNVVKLAKAIENFELGKFNFLLTNQAESTEAKTNKDDDEEGNSSDEEK